MFRWQSNLPVLIDALKRFPFPNDVNKPRLNATDGRLPFDVPTFGKPGDRRSAESFRHPDMWSQPVGFNFAFAHARQIGKWSRWWDTTKSRSGDATAKP